jgi:alpha-1,3-rhamnosyl/mannosyltransferase
VPRRDAAEEEPARGALRLYGLARYRDRKGAELQLVVTGEETAQLRQDLGLVARLGLSRFVSTPGVIDEADLPALLRLATAVPVLSRSEGFGLPVLEALASGTPVIVPRDSAQAEVAGEHGLRVRPHLADDVAEALLAAVERREELRAAVPERARELSWARCAAQVEELWEELA